MQVIKWSTYGFLVKHADLELSFQFLLKIELLVGGQFFLKFPLSTIQNICDSITLHNIDSLKHIQCFFCLRFDPPLTHKRSMTATIMIFYKSKD